MRQKIFPGFRLVFAFRMRLKPSFLQCTHLQNSSARKSAPVSNITSGTLSPTAAVVAGNFNHLLFFNRHRHHTIHGSLPFHLYWNATVGAEIGPATFGSAVEHHNCYATAADDAPVSLLQLSLEKTPPNHSSTAESESGSLHVSPSYEELLASSYSNVEEWATPQKHAQRDDAEKVAFVSQCLYLATLCIYSWTSVNYTDVHSNR